MKESPEMHSKSRSNLKCQGSALITAVIFSFLIGVLSVSFLKLATFEYSSSVRATLYSSSLNLAESGVEHAIEALAAGSISSSTWTKELDDFLVDRGFTGDVRILVVDATTFTPTIFSEGIVSGHSAGDVKKQVKVQLDRGFFPFEKGFSSRNGIRFSGNNVVLDSYNSDYGDYGETLDILGPQPSGYGYLGTNKNDGIYVASDLIETVGETAVDGGNAEIYGYVSVSPGNYASIGPNGMVTSYGSTTHDESRVLNNFYADFPILSQPSGSYDETYSSINTGGTITGSLVESAPTYYDIDEINLSALGDDLIIEGHVVFVMDGDISMTGNSSLTITEGSSLTIYTGDNVKISGNGVSNASGVPSDFFVYGTASPNVDSDGTTSSSQNISISGNGQLASAIYAPSAHVTLSGGGTDGEVMGGVVGFYAEITGGSSFHFDEAMRDDVFDTGVYSVTSWLEMTNETPGTKRIDFSQLFDLTSVMSIAL